MTTISVSTDDDELQLFINELLSYNQNDNSSNSNPNSNPNIILRMKNNIQEFIKLLHQSFNLYFSIVDALMCNL